MKKIIKKEIEKQLRDKNPSAEWQRLLARYLDDIAGTDKAVILRVRYERRRGYWQTLRELNRHGVYLSTTAFYQHLDEALAEIALRAAYERLICPYCLDKAEAQQESASE